MKGRFSVFLASAALLALCACGPLSAQAAEIQRVDDSIEIFRAISTSVDGKVPAYMMQNAQGIAIFPRVRRAGFVIGVQKGSGLLITRGSDGRWGNPLFLRLSGGSIGWQAGIQSVDLVLFLQSRKSVDGVLSGQFTIGVDASVSAGSTGRQAAANTDADLESEIYSYSRTRGFFAGLSLSGASLAVDYDANDAFFGRKDLRPRDILSGAPLKGPASADTLRAVLADYARTLKE
jgi:lipid-binding SYLF domain-containing protein